MTEIWFITANGVLMGVVNAVGQFMDANALALSGYMAAHFSVKGGGTGLEYRGIWYLAMLFSGLGVLAAITTVFHKKRSCTEE